MAGQKPSSIFIPDPQNAGNLVTETTNRNFGFRDATGLETIYSNQFIKKIFVNLDVTGQWIRLRNPDIPGIQSGTSLSGNASVNYMLSPEIGLFLNYIETGRQLTGLGYTSSTKIASLGLSYRLTPKLSLNLSINDLARSGKTVSVIDTTTIRSTFVNSHPAPSFMISLGRSFSSFRPGSK